MKSIVDRIAEVASSKGIRISALERQIGASKGVLSKAISNNTDIQSKWLMKIVENFPDISADWLLTGEGSMSCAVRTAIARRSEDKSGLPLIPINAMAGIASGQIDVMEYECERYVVPLFSEANFLITVKGSSMTPTYNSGDIVACKWLNGTNIFFQWNKVYVLDTDQGALIKRVHPGSEQGKVTLVSDNKEYTPFEIPLSSVHATALVIGVIRLE